MMNCDLIKELLRRPLDAPAVIGGQVITGVEVKTGTFHGDRFLPGEGSDKVLVFVAPTVMATGQVKPWPK